MMGERPRAGDVFKLALAVVFFTAAPTAGDIGSCGQAPDDLDPKSFFEVKATIDCRRCAECGFDTEACHTACSSTAPQAFAKGCFPVVHDGEVCLDALLATACADYAAFVSDVAPSAPTECNFCPPGAQP
jgi:hypothetical protein